MAGWAPARHAAFTWISRSVVLALLVATTAGQSVLAQSRQTGDGLPVGVPVEYESPDGSESLTLTVEEVIDPYERGLTAYDQDRLASETKRYVGVRLTIGNDAPEPLPYFFTSHIVIDAGATLHRPRSIQRDRETAAAEPSLKAGEVTAGGSISGLLFYELPEAAEVEMILFAPSPDRLITLASHGGQPDAAASATDEPATTATEAPTTATEAPTTATEAPTSEAEAPTTEGEAPTAVAAILRTGFPIPYRSLDGSTSMLLTVEEIIDPYEAVNAYEQARLSDEERRYVALRLSLKNALETPIPLFLPHGIRLLDTDTVLHTPGFAPRDSEAQAADPNLPSGEIGAGATISGLLFYELSETAELEEVIFLPSDDRLIKLATREPPRATSPDGADADDVAWSDDASGLPRPGPDIVEIAAKGAYHSAIFGYGLSWDPSLWTVREASAEPDHDRLVLGSGTVTIEVDGLSDLEVDARRCLIDRVYADLDVASGFDAAPADVLPPTGDDRLPPASGLYLLVHDDEDGRSHESVRYVECRPLPGNAAVLRLVMSAPTPRWIAERGLVIDVRSATTLLDQPPPSATQEAADRLSLLPAPSPMAPLSCQDLISNDDIEIALAVWERVRAGEDGDTLGHSGGEVCSEQIASDERIRLRLEPGDPSDFEPGAELLGVEGQPIPGFGHAALVFHGKDGGAAAGTSILAVREHRDVGDLLFRLTLGRPDLDSPARSLVLANLVRALLPRFPGIPVRVTGVLDADGLAGALGVEEVDRSDLSYVDNLRAKEEAGEWTRAEGLVATLKLFAGEVDAAIVLRHGEVTTREGSAIMAMAARYLDDGPDPEARAEIARLLDRLVHTSEELEEMAGIASTGVASAFESVATRTALPLGVGARGAPTLSRLASTRTAQDLSGLCQAYADMETPVVVGPCLEWKEVQAPPLSSTEYRVFVPAPGFPQGGWEPRHYDMAIDAIEHSARWFEGEGSQFVRAAGGPGIMPSGVNLVFSIAPRDIGGFALASNDPDGVCAIELYPSLQTDPERFFVQMVAHELAHCFEAVNFPEQVRSDFIDWWWEGLATYLSNVVYRYADQEWTHEDDAVSLARAGQDVSLLDLTYGTFLFWQYLERPIGIDGIFRLIHGLPAAGGRAAQEASLAKVPGMDHLFHEFAQKMVDGGIIDTGNHRQTARRVDDYRPILLARSFEVPLEIKPFAVHVVRWEVGECKRAELLIDPTSGRSSARPAAVDDWTQVPLLLPRSRGGPRDRLIVVSAMSKVSTSYGVRSVTDEPECAPPRSFVPPDPLDAFCDLGCEVSDYFPPLSEGPIYVIEEDARSGG